MYVRVFVVPNSKKERFIEVSERDCEATVKEPAERNLANTRVRELVAEHYQVPLGSVRIISGHHSPRKMLSVDRDRVQ